jgi:DUF1009 family protein
MIVDRAAVVAEANQRKLFVVGERLVGTDGPAP